MSKSASSRESLLALFEGSQAREKNVGRAGMAARLHLLRHRDVEVVTEDEGCVRPPVRPGGSPSEGEFHFGNAFPDVDRPDPAREVPNRSTMTMVR